MSQLKRAHSLISRMLASYIGATACSGATRRRHFFCFIVFDEICAPIVRNVNLQIAYELKTKQKTTTAAESAQATLSC